jgi:glutamate-5-semialdehyde dehydrogenase
MWQHLQTGKKTKRVILNAKTDKISACNALDKVLFNAELENIEKKLNELFQLLRDNTIQVLVYDLVASKVDGIESFQSMDIWKT